MVSRRRGAASQVGNPQQTSTLPIPPTIDERDVVPNESLPKQIFTHKQPEHISIILRNWENYVFKANLPDTPGSRRLPCVVRLEAKGRELSGFTSVSAIQKVATTCVSDLVPETFYVDFVAGSGYGYS